MPKMQSCSSMLHCQVEKGSRHIACAYVPCQQAATSCNVQTCISLPPVALEICKLKPMLGEVQRKPYITLLSDFVLQAQAHVERSLVQVCS